MKNFGSLMKNLFCGMMCVSLLSLTVSADVATQKITFDSFVHDNGEYDAEKNLLPNSSFEDGVKPDGTEGYSNLADKWQIWDGKASGESSGRIVSDANTGSYALEIKKDVMFSPDYRVNGAIDGSESVMYSIMKNLQDTYGTFNGKLVVSFYAKSDANASLQFNFRAGDAPFNINGKTSVKTLESTNFIQLSSSDEYLKYTVEVDLSGNLKNFSFWEGSKSYKVSDISSEGTNMAKFTYDNTAIFFRTASNMKIDDLTLEFKPQVYSAFGIQNYAGQKMYMETNIYNNSLSATGALLIHAMYDENNSLVSINSENISVNDADTVLRVKTEVDVPDNATDKYSLYTYLWQDDGENKAFCDENKAFSILNSNSSFEILDSSSDTGLLNWSKLNSSVQAELVNESYSGDVAVYLKPGSSKSGIKQNISEILDMYGPGRYGFNVRTKSLSNDSQIILTYVSNGNIVNTETISSGNSWDAAMFEFDVTDINKSYLYIETVNGSGVYIDDAVITKLDY